MRTAVCPFCLSGCELGLTVESRARFSVHYQPSGEYNQGRLCARGNAIPIILNHPKRLSLPVIRGQIATWNDLFNNLTQDLKNFKPEEIALGIDAFLTEEEKGLSIGLAESLGIKNVFASYLEPDQYFLFKVAKVKEANLETLKNADLILLIGDVFGQFPLIAKEVLHQKYQNRNNRLLGIDAVANRSSGFANQFFIVNPGSEPLFLLAITLSLGTKVKGLEIKELCDLAGVSLETTTRLAESLASAKCSVIISCLTAGRSYDPILYSLAGQLLSLKMSQNSYFLGLRNNATFVGKTPFGEILEGIRARKIKFLLNLGGYFPFFYPQLEEELKNLEVFYATAFLPLKPITDSLTLIPQALPLEEDGSLMTQWGVKKTSALIKPYSGSKTIKEILETIMKNLNLNVKEQTYPKEKIFKEKDVYERAREYLDTFKKEIKESLEGKIVVLGERPPIQFFSFFDKNRNLKVASFSSKIKEFETEIDNSLAKNVALLSSEFLETRRFFPIIIDRKEKSLIITPFTIEKNNE